MGLLWALVKDRSNEKKEGAEEEDKDVMDQGTDEPQTQWYCEMEVWE